MTSNECYQIIPNNGTKRWGNHTALLFCLAADEMPTIEHYICQKRGCGPLVSSLNIPIGVWYTRWTKIGKQPRTHTIRYQTRIRIAPLSRHAVAAGCSTVRCETHNWRSVAGGAATAPKLLVKPERT